MWRAAKNSELTPALVERAKAWLRSPDWKLGVLEETSDIQFRGAMHPNYGGKPGKHRGVEVWVRDDATPTSFPSSEAPTPPETPAVPRARGKVDANEYALVLQEAAKRGWPPTELDAAIDIESGWDPHISNRHTNAGGLIGFMPFVLRNLGWTGTPEQFRAQSAAAQAPWIGKYLDSVGKRWRYPGDTYVALAAAAYVGASDSTIVYQRGSKAWELNPGWRGPDGEIRAGSIRALLLRRMARLAQKRADGGVPVATKAAAGGGGLILLLLAYAVARALGWVRWP